MNLNKNPTVDQLREIIRRGNDSSGHHVLWANVIGDVELSRIPMNQTASAFDEAHPDMQFRFETFLAGNEYVGTEAADDPVWITELYNRLVSSWTLSKGKSKVEYKVTI